MQAYYRTVAGLYSGSVRVSIMAAGLAGNLIIPLKTKYLEIHPETSWQPGASKRELGPSLIFD